MKCAGKKSVNHLALTGTEDFFAPIRLVSLCVLLSFTAVDVSARSRNTSDA